MRAVDGVSLRIGPGETLALVGESGSGKTTTGRLITHLEPPSEGYLGLDGQDVTRLSAAGLKAYRHQVQMIFQNPFEALDPRQRMIASLTEPLRLHGIGTVTERRAKAEALLDAVELPRSYGERFPADLSGGQLQRIAIARALILSPRLVVADEPVSMLDVSVRAGTMNLMLDLQRRLGMSYLYITHDLSVARVMSRQIAVMYLGAIVEQGPTEALLAGAGHPYTRLLIAAVAEYRPGVPRRRMRIAADASWRSGIDGGCRFAPRCPIAQDRCRAEAPPPVTLGPSHIASCHFAGEVEVSGLAA